MSAITGSLQWDVFVVYIVFCVFFVTICCLFVVCLFWCRPSANPNNTHNSFFLLAGSPVTAVESRLPPSESCWNRAATVRQSKYVAVAAAAAAVASPQENFEYLIHDSSF
jgi:hypothetical protein